MKRLLITSVIVGAIAGLLVGGFHNLFTVPVIERAIILEEQQSASVTPTGAESEGEGSGADVSLGVQRFGMAFGTVILGAVVGLFFAAGFVLLHRVVPTWPVVWVALTVGALGFWGISLFPFIEYPLNPPGESDEATLLARQMGQSLFMLISTAAVGVLLDAFRRINQNFAVFSERRTWYGLALAIYAALALVMVFVFPGNPDPALVPIDLLELFRALTMIGHFLTWALLAVGVALALIWHQRSATGRTIGSTPAAGFAR